MVTSLSTATGLKSAPAHLCFLSAVIIYTCLLAKIFFLSDNNRDFIKNIQADEHSYVSLVEKVNCFNFSERKYGIIISKA